MATQGEADMFAESVRPLSISSIGSDFQGKTVSPAEPQSPAGSDSGSEYSQPHSVRSSRHSSTRQSTQAYTAPSSLRQSASEPLHNIQHVSSEDTTQQQTYADGLEFPAELEAAEVMQGMDSTAAGSDQVLIPDSRPTSLSLITPGHEAQRPYPAEDTSNTAEAITEEPQSRSPVSSITESASAPQTPTKEISPVNPPGQRKSGESFASIALSVSSLDYDRLSAQQVEDVMATPRISSMRHLRKPSSIEALQQPWGPMRQDTLFDISKDNDNDGVSPAIDDAERAPSHSITPSVSLTDVDVDETAIWAEPGSPRRRSSSGSESLEVDWLALDKTEEQEKEDRDLPEGMEDESTKFLLARLEQENAKFEVNPRPTKDKSTHRARSDTRPPSIAHLKKLVSGGEASANRYSISIDRPFPEEPPPMTELEFWAALVQDYPSTASRLPTLTTAKIRSGIPPPLRGVVWSSMSGARSRRLEHAFERLQHESSPYEGIINKDVGRSFPGVELFRDADGEGQKMLGKVLKCFSLHDKEIGYCQGLGFLVGPLLMNMGEKDAFCVLVRLMEHYALRPSFLPSLSGLHMRIFQFSTLLKQHHPELSAHLSNLGVEPAYLSQWFLSCFAVTCPLSMLFRIYDVVFAEGANETIMRVALALFRRNEKKIMASHEFEEVMQLLLGRSLWDCYGFNADELVDDFTGLGNIITHERLAELEKQFENQSQEAVGQSAGFLPDVQAAAGRFLGRLWSANTLHTPSKSTASLSPSSADKEGSSTSSMFSRGNFLKRTPSKQSIYVSNENGSEDTTSSGSASLTSTVPTELDGYDVSRDSQMDIASFKSKPTSVIASQSGLSREHHDLHIQIEDLLLALSEAQREQAQLAAMLQREREERNDDHRAVGLLLNKLRRGSKKGNRSSMPPPLRIVTQADKNGSTAASDKRRTLPPRPRPQVNELPPSLPSTPPTDDDVLALVEQVQERLETNARFSASFETKAHLRSTLTRTREQLATAEQSLRELTDRAEFAETSLMTFQNESESLRAEVEELRVRVNDEFRTRQKLELQLQNMEIQIKMEARSLNRRERLDRADSAGEIPTLVKLDTTENGLRRQNSLSSTPGSTSGLREFKLGVRDSSGSVASIRSMRSQRRTSTSPALSGPNSPQASVSVDSVPALVPTEPTSTTPNPVLATPPATERPQTAQAPAVQTTASSSLSVPQFQRTGFARRTSSLAAKEVFATPEHEPVPEDALLLELVNAKTAEAQARQEVDELKRSFNQQKRRAEDSYAQMQAELEAVREEVRKAQNDAKIAREEAETARREVFDAAEIRTPALSWPETPSVEVWSSGSPVAGTALEATAAEAKKAGTGPASPNAPTAAASAAASAVGGWFWGRRTASTNRLGSESS